MQQRSHGAIQMKGQCRCGNVVGTDVVALIVIVIGGGGGWVGVNWMLYLWDPPIS